MCHRSIVGLYNHTGLDLVLSLIGSYLHAELGVRGRDLIAMALLVL